MIFALQQKVAVLLCFWLPTVYPCDQTIYPVDPAVPFGGSVTLNCTSSCANDTELNWELSVRGDTQKGPGWISVSFVNITLWDFQPVCFGDSAKAPTKMPIYLYQFSSPDIHLASEIIAGHWHTVVCNISSLKVRGQIPTNINISLSSGGRILNSSQGNSSVEYTSVAKLEQDGAEILCVAHLKVGREVLEKTANSTLKVAAQPHNISIISSVTAYKAGSNITVTCRAEGNPFPKFTWDLPSPVNVEYSNRNRTVTIHSAQSSHNGTYQCHAQNPYGSDLAHIDILYEGKSRNWVTAVVVVVVVSLLVTVFIIYYRCRK
ncbi:vascular cell adhesion protein 1-like [Eublepharis macularius]|uniref:Vascular cell adhesion protein 1-like n=1 Tax=Eublepharis macularius TaxID=481883 RepID=A0AA97KNB6_EUBMA|nr:vascular cell adhesion protein 1-like [Eublepharis macularius]